MSIKNKLTIGISGIIIIVLTVFFVVMHMNDTKTRTDYMKDNAEQMSEFLVYEVENNTTNDVESFMNLSELFITANPYVYNVIMTDNTTNEHYFAKQSEVFNPTNHHFKWQDKSFQLVEDKQQSYFISRYQAANKWTIYFILDRDKLLLSGNVIQTFIIVTFYLILFGVIISYIFVGRLLEPLRNILWKVNEVSSVRFKTSIPITTQDEFGLLAFKINAMSQKLSIYTTKLQTMFEEKNQMRHQLESFIDHSPDAIYIVDLYEKVVRVNLAFEQLSGYRAKEVIGQRNMSIPESHEAEMNILMEKIRQGGSTAPIESFVKTKFGELIPVSVTITPVMEEDNQIAGFVVVARDMSQRNQMEELIRRSEKLNTVGQLAAGVAHEIRNPLTTLRGFLQMQLRTEHFNKQHIEVMLSELDRINLIVSEFLILSKPQAIRFNERDVRQILSQVISLMDSEAILHNVVIRPFYTEVSCLVECEENQLKQVFINLIKNAIEAMPSGGNILVLVERNETHVVCHVKDEGIGIDEESLKRIGDPFFTGKENGTGLGMMVSQKIINAHNGTMNIQSKVNQGTTISVILPCSS